MTHMIHVWIVMISVCFLVLVHSFSGNMILSADSSKSQFFQLHRPVSWYFQVFSLLFWQDLAGVPPTYHGNLRVPPQCHVYHRPDVVNC